MSHGDFDLLSQLAGEVMELTPLFQGGAPQIPPMPGM
jgi:hypothetical protein